MTLKASYKVSSMPGGAEAPQIPTVLFGGLLGQPKQPPALIWPN